MLYRLLKYHMCRVEFVSRYISALLSKAFAAAKGSSSSISSIVVFPRFLADPNAPPRFVILYSSSRSRRGGSMCTATAAAPAAAAASSPYCIRPRSSSVFAVCRHQYRLHHQVKYFLRRIYAIVCLLVRTCACMNFQYIFASGWCASLHATAVRTPRQLAAIHSSQCMYADETTRATNGEGAGRKRGEAGGGERAAI